MRTVDVKQKETGPFSRESPFFAGVFTRKLVGRVCPSRKMPRGLRGSDRYMASWLESTEICGLRRVSYLRIFLLRRSAFRIGSCFCSCMKLCGGGEGGTALLGLPRTILRS